MWATLIVSILSALLPVAVKLIGNYFERKEGQEAAREAFLKFVEAMQAQASGPAKLRKSYKDQIERLKAVKEVGKDS